MDRTKLNPSLMPFPGGWEAHRHRHCIWIVSLEGYGFSHAFDELAEALEEAFRELGGSAPIARKPDEWNGRTPIILGANLLQLARGFQPPPGSVPINLEQVDPANPWFTDAYVDLLRRYPVLDYSPRNQAGLRRVGIDHAGLLEIGYSPVLTRIPAEREKDIDILFYGSNSERRQRIIEELVARGFNAVRLHKVFGEKRDAAIARAKLVVNIHYYPSSVFEIVRVSYLLANSVCVVSEGDPNDPDVAPFLGGLELAAYDQLVDRCAELARDADRREALARAGFDNISARRQANLLQRCFSS